MFEPVPSEVSFPRLEERRLAFWRAHDTFRQSLRLREGRQQFVFYDGPPFANGLPHYGHLLAGTIKDVVPRYQTMRGRYVERVFGWDCHGLPVENEIERQMDINSKRQIEAYGIARFNEACRGTVLRYTREWEAFVERIGRWVDFQNGYRTMDTAYMESIWWVFRQLWDRGLVYEGHKILPYCPRCATPLSNFEANQGYEDVQDPSVTLRFRDAADPNLYYLAWTTTPWTLPSNLALCAGPDIEYLEVEDGDVRYLLAADRLAAYYPKERPRVRARLHGRDLAGRRYEPLFPYFADLATQGAFRLITADYVSTEDGTGIVHTAPGFGEEDAEAGRRHGVPVVCPIDAECRFTAEVADYQGRPVKETDRDIIRRLKDEGKLIHQSTCQHSYPHCWRCETPLIYRAVSTWFVKVEQLKDRLLAANAQIHWVPEHIKDGRFGNWLKNAHDWAVSRNRYWGCPLPVWRNEEGETLCVGSVAELEQRTGRRVEDIHKHFVDDLEIPSPAGGRPLRRVPEVLDCWFESGSMPYAQHHYPFESKAHVEAHFPADFIAEGLDQTRGWFYTLVVLGVALFDKPAFRHVVVNGMVLAEDGKKMSKRLKNYPDPIEVMNTYGADALRLTLLASPVVRGEDLRFSDKAVREVMRTVILPIWNAYSFLVTYARVDGWQPDTAVAAPPPEPHNTLDRWILSRLEGTVADVAAAMDDYELQRAAQRFTALIDDLTNWYIRRSRRRFWKSQNDADKAEAYATLHYVLVSFAQVAAPFIPFVTDEIYGNLRTPQMRESVHLSDFPEARVAYRDPALDRRMDHTMRAVSLGRFLRTQAAIRVRQPLPAAVLVSHDAGARADLEAMAETIAEELNVKSISVRADEEELVELSAKANFKTLGPRLGRRMKAAADAVARLSAADIRRLRQGETVRLDLGGEPAEIAEADVCVLRRERPGIAVANEGAVTVALDTRLDERLLQEGWARELVSRVQSLRKEAGLEVADRIRVRYDLPPELAAAAQAFHDYIAGETLAVELRAGSIDDPAAAVDLNGVNGRVQVEKADVGPT
ncbi:MAG: Isoleucine--tRNA ligase [Lentisphaerae bacterium ADurb.BinA184]|nr:MAG: Isoleucine--tRNA ligase [Lentisphaerae bacterium ADurb.BinA184]